ncbi:hypothetical protein ACFQRK_10145 [Parapedobacter sp. GCM10030251]|jgi:hypothetical protein|uniref:hypothetical protein n=1 Tax=Parapedobacter sp. GCM10030251 TaxID=3273419 RepID=UPI0036088BDD
MKTLVIFILSGILLTACNHTPPNGGDPAHRDSTGDPIGPADSVDRLDPDSVTDTPQVEF